MKLFENIIAKTQLSLRCIAVSMYRCIDLSQTEKTSGIVRNIVMFFNFITYLFSSKIVQIIIKINLFSQVVINNLEMEYAVKDELPRFLPALHRKSAGRVIIQILLFRKMMNHNLEIK